MSLSTDTYGEGRRLGTGGPPSASEPVGALCGTTTAASSARGGVFRVHDSESIEVFGAVLKMFPEWAGRVVPFGFDWLGCQFALAAGFFEEWLAGAGKAPAWGRASAQLRLGLTGDTGKAWPAGRTTVIE